MGCCDEYTYIFETGSIGMAGWMLVASHFLMAVQAILYLTKYQVYTYSYCISRLYGHYIMMSLTMYMDKCRFITVFTKYSSHIGYFTFWLSVSCIFIAVYVYKAEELFAKERVNY